MKGSTYKRCPCGETGGGPSRPPACKKKHGSWYYVADLGPDPATGDRRQRKKGGFPTKDSAEEACRAVIEAASAGMAPSLDRRSLGVYLDAWVASRRGIREVTRANYEHLINTHIKPAIGAVRMRDLTADHVDIMLNRMATVPGQHGKIVSNATAHRVFACLRKALNDAVRRRPQVIPFNPCLGVELAPEERKEIQVWTPDQIRRFLAAVSESRLEADRRLAPLYRLILVRGLRRGEAVGLQWEGVDLDAGTIRPILAATMVRAKVVLGPLKTARSKDPVTIGPATVAALRAHRKAQAAEKLAAGADYQDLDLVFARPDGSVEHPEQVYRRFQAIAEEIGLPVIPLHGGRHSAATAMREAGHELADVRDVLRHTTIQTTQIYTHAVPARQTRGAADMDDLIDGTTAKPRRRRGRKSS